LWLQGSGTAGVPESQAHVLRLFLTVKRFCGERFGRPGEMALAFAIRSG